MESEQGRKRRRYSPQLKAQILGEFAAPDASVARVALSHGINANIVHGWSKQAQCGEAAAPVLRQDFVPVAVAPAVQAGTDERGIEIELRRGSVSVVFQ